MITVFTVRAEWIGRGYDQDVRALTAMVGSRRGDMLNPPPWLAEITGLDPKYGFARTFRDADRWDKSEASSTHNRGVYLEWDCEPGRLYERRWRESWKGGYNRQKFTVSDEGDLIELTDDEVREWLATTPQTRT